MATKESSANFSGKNWGGYCQITYTAGNGAINITGMEFKATNSTSAGYGAYYDNQQNITVEAGGQKKSCTLRYVRIKQTSYYAATFSGASFSGLSGNTSVSFTCRARADSPYNLTFTYTIDAGNAVVVPSVSGLSVSATNETTITASFNITSNGGATATGYITCNGQTKAGTSATFTGLASGEYYTVTAYASNSAGNSGTLSGGARTYYIPHVTGCTSSNIGDEFTVTVYNELNRYYTLQLISTVNNQVVGEYTGSRKGNVTGFNDTATQNKMYQSIPSDTRGQYRTKLISDYGTHEGDSRGYGYYYAIESRCKPTFSNFIWEDVNPITLALTGDSSIVVNGYSNIQATIPVADKMEAKNYASPRRYEFVVGSMSKVDITYSSSADVSGIQQKVTSNTFQVRAVDTREFPSSYVTKTATNYINYSPLAKTNASVSRVGEVSSQTTLSFSGTIWNDSFGSVTNSIKNAKYKYKTGSGDWSNDISITPTVSDNTFSFNSQIAGDEGNSGFNVQNVYTIVVTVEDELSSVEWTLTLNSGSPHLAWHKNGLSVMGKYNTSSGGKFQIAGTNIFDLIYPVGSVYLSVNSTSPATLFGVGTWERLQSGFLYGAVNSSGNGGGTGTKTGGNSDNTSSTAISESQMPSHSHGRGTMNITGQFRTRAMSNGDNIADTTDGSGAFTHTFDGGAVWYNALSYTGTSGLNTDLINFDASRNWSGTSEAKGGGQGHTHTLNGHTHQIPYMAVFMWKRTA